MHGSRGGGYGSEGGGAAITSGDLSTMAVTEDYLQYVLEQLTGLGQVTTRRMFGAVGLYHDARFFGIVAGDVLYFKVNDSNRGDYEARGMDRFRPFPDKPLLSMTYYAVPADTLEDAEECALWARKSAAIAAIATKPEPRRSANPTLRRSAKPAARRAAKRGR
jgi:DNA transformation protein and related proteins